MILLVCTSIAPAADVLPVRKPAKGIWISRTEVLGLSTSGAAWKRLEKAADSTPPTPELRDQNQSTNVTVLAKALVFARTGKERYRREVRGLCMAAIDTERGGRTLALGRELAAYVIAADIVGLDKAQDRRFRAWLIRALTQNLSGRTLRSTHEKRPNNWGTHAGASRMAVALYLGDQKELQRAARVFKGWLGDRKAFAGFKYGDLDWQADPSSPVGINPKGATKNGHLIDGVLPDDMRRGGSLRFPPGKTQYAWEALQGAVVQAEILHRAGYDAWEWQDRALLRAVEFLYRIDWKAEGDDRWQIWLINRRYGARFPTPEKPHPGKNMGWTDWTHSG